MSSRPLMARNESSFLPVVTTMLLLILLSCSRLHAAEHPLDALSKEEIQATVGALKAAGKITDSSRFVSIALREPAKEEVLRFKPGDTFQRESFVILYDRARKQTIETVLDLKTKAIVSWKEVPEAKPSLGIEEIETANKAVHADPRWQEAIRRRGITDLENVSIDPWTVGRYGIAEEEGKRLVKANASYRGSNVNYYARPIEGVIATVDLDSGKVLKVVDTGVVPVPKAAADLDPKSIGTQRIAPTKLQSVQPEGPSFAVNGYEVSWQNWRFRFGTRHREGLVLYTVSYRDAGRERPVLYRGSVSEMLVPYADPGPSWFFRNVFDEGEYGLGWLLGPLEPRADAPENAEYFDAVFVDDRGGIAETPRAVALYERDGGLLWKHLDFETRKNESRRARELVLGCIATVGNYEYAFNWVFHQDGTLEMEVQLTGIMQPKGVTASKQGDHGGGAHDHLVAENIAAVHHQHFFSFRLDLDVDGADGNSVVEMNTTAMPMGPKNPYGRAFTASGSPLRTELQARRQLKLAANRMWKVMNPGSRNALGQPAGYVLLPGENTVPFIDPAASVRKRAGFVNAHLWVTPYNPSELYAAGDYPNQSKGGDGLPKWTSANRSIEDKDIVVWYTLGITHIPRPEEWPVMNVHRAGFKLMPSAFFSRNPALDVPPETAH